MTWTYDERLIAEEDYIQYMADLSPAELAEMIRRQEEEREADYFEAAWAEMREADEVITSSQIHV